MFAATTNDLGQLHILTDILPWLGIFVASTLVLALVVSIVLRLVNIYRLYKQETTLFELTPPAFTDKTPQATEELISIMYGLHRAQTWIYKTLRQHIAIALEVASTNETGIRFFIRIKSDDAHLIEQNLHAYLPETKIKAIEDYLPALVDPKQSRVHIYKQAAHFAQPIMTQKSLEQHDPIAYLTTAMTQLTKGELIAFQTVVSPAVIAEARQIDRKIRSGEDAGASLSKGIGWRSLLYMLFFILKLPFTIITAVAYAIFYDDLPDDWKSTRKHVSAKVISPAEQDAVDIIHDKLTQQLFYADIRVLVVAPTKTKRKERLRSMRSSLESFTRPKKQYLKPLPTLLSTFTTRFRMWFFQHRLPALLHKNSSILAVSELASIFHFPHSSSAKTENVVKSLSKPLPAPVSLKGNPKLDVILGENHYHGSVTPIGLTADQRERHMYIIGGTGNGKTTMLEYALVQDIQAGKGVAFIDPHGDAAQKLLQYIPESRMKDVIYLNPTDIAYPVGINLLELPTGLSHDQLLLEKERVTEAIVSTLRKVFADDDASAHRIEAMLRNVIRTVFTVDDATLFTAQRLLRNTSFRNSVVTKLDDQDLKDFWREEFGKAGGMQRVSMTKGLTHRLDRFRSSEPVYRTFNQIKSTINFEDIMNNGKILICNFSTEMGEDTSSLFGTAVLAQLKIAAERRRYIPVAERRPFHVYVDEFQNFATTPFTKMLSTARKYKLFLTIAEQSTAQQDDQRMVETILANVGTMITFRTGSPLDEQLMLARFRPFVEEGDIANLPAYNFYMRVAGIQTQEPMSGETLLLDNAGSNNISEQVITSSRKQFSKKYVEPNAKRQTGSRNKNNSKTKKPQKDNDQEGYVDV